MATIQVQGIYKKGADGIFYSLRGNYVKDANNNWQQFKPGDGIKGANWYVLKDDDATIQTGIISLRTRNFGSYTEYGYYVGGYGSYTPLENNTPYNILQSLRYILNAGYSDINLHIRSNFKNRMKITFDGGVEFDLALKYNYNGSDLSDFTLIVDGGLNTAAEFNTWLINASTNNYDGNVTFYFYNN